MRNNRIKYIMLPTVGGIVLILDQLTKLIVVKQLGLYQTVSVIPGFFNLTRLNNPGGAFGFMADQTQGIRIILFIVISLLAVVFIVYLYCQTPRAYRFLLGGLALVFGGALGNLVDRIRFGAVVDFLDFYIAGWHWPAFNVADSAISVGMTILVFHIVFKKVPL